MKILENVMDYKKSEENIIILITPKEANIIYNAMSDYCNNRRRLKIAAKMKTQMYNELPVSIL